MNRSRKLAQTIWHCQYHIVRTLKYTYGVVTGDIAEEVDGSIMTFSEQPHREMMERSVRMDHVYVVVMISPKISVSEYVGILRSEQPSVCSMGFDV